MKTRVYKHAAYGWMAESVIPLGDGSDRHLEFSTMKRHNGLVNTVASIVEIKGNIKRFVMFGDYRKDLKNQTKVKATEKAITSIHTEAVEANLLDVLAEAKAYYVNNEG